MTRAGHMPSQFSAAETAALVEAIAAERSKSAFASLFEYYAPRLKGYLRRLSADDVLAEELVQDVMLTVWRKANQFDRRKSAVSTWLFTIARNRWIDTMRRDRSGELDPHDPMLLPDDPEPPDEAIDAARRAERVREALDALPEEQVELIRMAFYSGISHSAIAEQTGLPLGTVKSRLRLAFSKLRARLEDRA